MNGISTPAHHQKQSYRHDKAPGADGMYPALFKEDGGEHFVIHTAEDWERKQKSSRINTTCSGSVGEDRKSIPKSGHLIHHDQPKRIADPVFPPDSGNAPKTSMVKHSKSFDVLSA
ncbi:hypothetical protein T265_10709 [Opisthorchis viverrini]|uniref:Uncharacterized protein n=1 Tax=Opisthorchis viverrini TaxID=6198 RepID=A0A074Z1A4_OPIVI|nr:hypothetical protein T265_10709 [Opisthorchis viverrini]KER20836.1 hypothetical protein T265_10709 [Opisthorchis viverrini]